MLGSSLASQDSSPRQGPAGPAAPLTNAKLASSSVGRRPEVHFARYVALPTTFRRRSECAGAFVGGPVPGGTFADVANRLEPAGGSGHDAGEIFGAVVGHPCRGRIRGAAQPYGRRRQAQAAASIAKRGREHLRPRARQTPRRRHRRRPAAWSARRCLRAPPEPNAGSAIAAPSPGRRHLR